MSEYTFYKIMSWASKLCSRAFCSHFFWHCLGLNHFKARQAWNSAWVSVALSFLLLVLISVWIQVLVACTIWGTQRRASNWNLLIAFFSSFRWNETHHVYCYIYAKTSNFQKPCHTFTPVKKLSECLNTKYYVLVLLILFFTKHIGQIVQKIFLSSDCGQTIFCWRQVWQVALKNKCHLSGRQNIVKGQQLTIGCEKPSSQRPTKPSRLYFSDRTRHDTFYMSPHKTGSVMS